MEYSFPRYLLAKQSVDNRALNKDVISAMKASLPDKPLTLTEVGAGIGTMLVRLMRLDMISQATYTLVDGMAENIEFAALWLPQWASENDLEIKGEKYDFRIYDEKRDIFVKLVQADVFEFIARNLAPADLLIAHAFLNLLPMPESLPKLFALTPDTVGAWSA